MRLDEALAEFAPDLSAAHRMAVWAAGVPSDLPVTWNARLQTCAGRCMMRRHAGETEFRPVAIQLNPKLKKEGAAELRETFLHEVAHAMASERGHGYNWRNACRRIGIPDTSRTHAYASMDRKRQPRKPIAKCDGCSNVWRRARRPTKGPLAKPIGTKIGKCACGGWVSIV